MAEAEGIIEHGSLGAERSDAVLGQYTAPSEEPTLHVVRPTVERRPSMDALGRRTQELLSVPGQRPRNFDRHRPKALTAPPTDMAAFRTLMSPKLAALPLDPRSPRTDDLPAIVEASTKSVKEMFKQSSSLILDNSFDFTQAYAEMKKKKLQEKLEKFKAVIAKGVPVLKHGKSGKPQKRTLTCDPEMTMVLLDGTPYVHVIEITDVKSGHQTAVFQRSGSAEEDHLCFSLITERRTLDLQSQTQTERDLLVEGFEVLVSNNIGLDKLARSHLLNVSQQQYRGGSSLASESRPQSAVSVHSAPSTSAQSLGVQSKAKCKPKQKRGLFGCCTSSQTMT
eukprot:GILJ01001671.1.p1 GENE.GILJ01001671.1~~GILJ01001671.1.p1  ORF type:complete len:337 (-),score=47.93 GILJ01001671.1:552-1562(-)